ncbi:DUF2281 domain-containing protein [Geminocystis sp. GBBB08]|uniref:DUF2281 domain-containing protein n=1 Tax=Geminocystis sp. GBBB08 TaxID=2604140 RepID=UPI0027E22D93|nr:DUF2281 domain-containing protein [Geminocystis sp. GBBB08]MBL1208393.1 DUF2281 domain-containing protein [Geminocystis sp. GBBB08]
MNIIDLVKEKMEELPPEKQQEILNFVEFLMIKYQRENTKKKYAEQLAIERIKDIDDPTKWEIVIDVDDEIDENALEEWLEKRGYKTLSNQIA